MWEAPRKQEFALFCLLKHDISFVRKQAANQRTINDYYWKCERKRPILPIAFPHKTVTRFRNADGSSVGGISV